MEALGIFKFWPNTAVRADVGTQGDCNEEETNHEDSLFDLEFKLPPGRGEDHVKKDSRFIESPRDVFPSKNDFSSSREARSFRSAQKFKVFALSFKKSQSLAKVEVSETSAGQVFRRENCVVLASPDKPIPKYLKLIKPFYLRDSSKAKPADSVTPSSSPVTAPVAPSPRKSGKVSRVGIFKIMTRSFGKSRSASTVDGAAPPSIRMREARWNRRRNSPLQKIV